MKSQLLRRSASRRGFASLIGLLLCLAIIGILVYKGYFEEDPVTGQRQAKVYTDKSKGAACAMNLQTLRAEVMQAKLSGGGQLPSPMLLRERFKGRAHCPEDGKYQVDNDGNVYCTKHEPCPESLTVSVMDIN